MKRMKAGPGQAVIISGPSGVGKSTIISYLMEVFPCLKFSVSATNRLPREGEIEGESYYFLSEHELQKHIKSQDFLEYEEVYPGTFYGTLIAEVDRLWSGGFTVLFDIDVKGAIALKSRFGDHAISIFIAPPSIEDLHKRLESRGSESEDKIATRLDRAQFEMAQSSQFDKVVVNDQLKRAQQETEEILQHFLLNPSSHTNA